MKSASQSIALWIVLLIAAAVTFTQVSCSGTDSRRATLAADLVAVNTASDLFTKWDRAYQMHLVEISNTREEADRRVAAYRKVQAKVLESFALVYGSIAKAATDDGDGSLKAARQRAADIIKHVHDLKPDKPPSPMFTCGFGLIPEPPLTCPN